MPIVEPESYRGRERYLIQHRENGKWVTHAKRLELSHAQRKAYNDANNNGEDVAIYDKRAGRIIGIVKPNSGKKFGLFGA